MEEREFKAKSLEERRITARAEIGRLYEEEQRTATFRLSVWQELFGRSIPLLGEDSSSVDFSWNVSLKAQEQGLLFEIGFTDDDLKSWETAKKRAETIVKNHTSVFCLLSLTNGSVVFKRKDGARKIVPLKMNGFIKPSDGCWPGKPSALVENLRTIAVAERRRNALRPFPDRLFGAVIIPYLTVSQCEVEIETGACSFPITLSLACIDPDDLSIIPQVRFPGSDRNDVIDYLLKRVALMCSPQEEGATEDDKPSPSFAKRHALGTSLPADIPQRFSSVKPAQITMSTFAGNPDQIVKWNVDPNDGLFGFHDKDGEKHISTHIIDDKQLERRTPADKDTSLEVISGFDARTTVAALACLVETMSLHRPWQETFELPMSTLEDLMLLSDRGDILKSERRAKVADALLGMVHRYGIDVHTPGSEMPDEIGYFMELRAIRGTIKGREHVSEKVVTGSDLRGKNLLSRVGEFDETKELSFVIMGGLWMRHYGANSQAQLQYGHTSREMLKALPELAYRNNRKNEGAYRLLVNLMFLCRNNRGSRDLLGSSVLQKMYDAETLDQANTNWDARRHFAERLKSDLEAIVSQNWQVTVEDIDPIFHPIDGSWIPQNRDGSGYRDYKGFMKAFKTCRVIFAPPATMLNSLLQIEENRDQKVKAAQQKKKRNTGRKKSAPQNPSPSQAVLTLTGDQIREARIRKQMSQRDVVEQMVITKRHAWLQRIESGEIRQIKTKYKVELARILGIK